MNRRLLLVSGMSLIAFPFRSLAFDDRTHPVDFVSRTFLGSNFDAVDAVRFLKSSAFQFGSAEDARTAITLLSEIRMMSSMDERSLRDVRSIEPDPDFDAEDLWFVSYSTIAGAAAFESHHAHAVFSTHLFTCEVVVSTNEPMLAVTELRRLTLLISKRARSQTPLVASNLVLQEFDLPADMTFSTETTPAGSSDRQGTPIPDDVPSWELV